MTEHNNVRIRVDFANIAQDRPVWTIATSAGPLIRETVLAFASNNVQINLEGNVTTGELWINGEAFLSSAEQAKRVLCASFLTPPPSCQHLSCAPQCWPELLGNQICDSVCFTSQCRYDFSDCGAGFRELRARTRSSSSSGSSEGSCSTTGCRVGLAVGCILL